MGKESREEESIKRDKREGEKHSRNNFWLRPSSWRVWRRGTSGDLARACADQCWLDRTSAVIHSEDSTYDVT